MVPKTESPKALKVISEDIPDAREEGAEVLASMMSVPLVEAWIIEAALIVLRGEDGEVLA